MPYKLQKARNRDLYWVVNKETKEKFSKDPIPRERAKAQMRALYAQHKKGGAGVGYMPDISKVPEWLDYIPVIGEFLLPMRSSATVMNNAIAAEGARRQQNANEWLVKYYNALAEKEARTLQPTNKQPDWSRIVLSDADIQTIMENRGKEEDVLVKNLTANQKILEQRKAAEAKALALQRTKTANLQQSQALMNAQAAAARQQALTQSAQASSNAMMARAEQQRQQQLSSQQSLQRAMASEAEDVQKALAQQKAAQEAQQQQRAAALANVQMLEAQQKYIPTMTTVARPTVRLPPPVRIKWHLQ